MLGRIHESTDGSSHQTKLSKFVYAVLFSCLLILSISITSVSSLPEVSQTISSSGMIEYSTVTYFETGFETGDLSEVNTEITDPATINVVSGKPHTGTYSAKIYTATGGPQGRGRLYKNLPDLEGVYVRAYFYIDYWNGYIQVIRTAGHTQGYYTYIARVVISSSYVELQLGMKKTLDGGDPNPGNWWPAGESGPVSKRTSHSFQTDQWYCIEMRFKGGSSGEGKVWVDGAQKISYSGDMSGAPDIDKAIVGVCLYQTGVNPATIYVDDFAIFDQ